MKKTEFWFMVRATTWRAIWRRVWEQDGRYFIKDGGKTWDVTDRKDSFCRW